MSSAGRILVVGATLLLGVYVPTAAQSPGELSATCAAGGGNAALCAATVIAARALAADLGVAAGLGSEIPGTASNLGQRLGASPRVALAARAGVVRMSVPDLFDGTGFAETSFSVPTVGVDAIAGLFDGFRLMPTVGGFLAVDVFGRLGVAFVPGESGFHGGNAVSYALGARVGVFRESFTLPGVSVSASRRFVGDVSFGGEPLIGDPARIWLESSRVTSIRATVGKDLFAVEVLAGVGRDDISTDARYQVRNAAAPGLTERSGSLDGARWLYFVSGSRSFNIVFSISLEAGFAEGFDPVVGHTGSFDPAGRTFFAATAFRLTI